MRRGTRVAGNLASAVLVGLLLTGCALLDTGPKVAALSVDAAKAGVVTLLSSFDAEEQTVGIEADVKNPEYQATVFVGAGTLVQLNLRAIGMDAEFELDATGTGKSVDPELRATLVAILERRDITEAEKTRMIFEILKALANQLSEPPVTTQPYPDPGG